MEVSHHAHFVGLSFLGTSWRQLLEVGKNHLYVTNLHFYGIKQSINLFPDNGCEGSYIEELTLVDLFWDSVESVLVYQGEGYIWLLVTSLFSCMHFSLQKFSIWCLLGIS